MQTNANENGLPTRSAKTYAKALRALKDARARFLIGGAYALAQYTGVTRRTKDLDVFCHPNDAERLLDVLRRAGFHTTLPYPHWLGKAYAGDDYVDIIFGSSNGIAMVDEEWFRYAAHGELLGVPVLFCPPEETIWSKAWVMDRERFDGADIAHLLRACGEGLDWDRLVRRFGESHWEVLLFHLLHFGFVYPGERPKIPEQMLHALVERVREPRPNGTEAPAGLCRGTLFSGEQYRIDIEKWGYQDARVQPVGTLTAEDVGRPPPVPPQPELKDAGKATEPEDRRGG